MSISHQYELLSVLVAKDFKVRYKSTALGFLWSLANPFFYALVLSFVFSNILSRDGLADGHPYFVFLLSALFPWQWFAGTTNASPTIFLSNAGLIKRVYFPRFLLPLSTLLNNLIHFMLALLVAIPLLALNGIYPSPLWIVGIPLLIVIQALLTLGVCLAISSLNVVFRDLQHLTIIITQLLFFLTPIIYSESMIPESKRWLIQLNPLYFVISGWRNLMLKGEIHWAHLGTGFVYGGVICLLGYAVYRRLEWRLAESV